nr:unnamed protein product [Digitaria exilis]
MELNWGKTDVMASKLLPASSGGPLHRPRLERRRSWRCYATVIPAADKARHRPLLLPCCRSDPLLSSSPPHSALSLATINFALLTVDVHAGVRTLAPGTAFAAAELLRHGSRTAAALLRPAPAELGCALGALGFTDARRELAAVCAMRAPAMAGRSALGGVVSRGVARVALVSSVAAVGSPEYGTPPELRRRAAGELGLGFSEQA